MKDEASCKELVVNADSKRTEDFKENLDERRESTSKPTTKIIHIKKKLHSIYHVPFSIIKDKVCLGAILLFVLFASAYVGFDECFSLWAATSKPLGGLGFSLNQIGTALSMVGVIMMPVMLIAFNFIDRRLGALVTHHISTAAVIIFVTLFPSLTYLSGNTISSVVFGTVYSLSLSEAAQDIGFPVDFHLAFLLISCGFLLTMILVSFFLKGWMKKDS